MNEVKPGTRACTGLCRGMAYRRVMSQMLAQETREAIRPVEPSTFRPPVKPAGPGVLALLEIDCAS